MKLREKIGIMLPILLLVISLILNMRNIARINDELAYLNEGQQVIMYYLEDLKKDKADSIKRDITIINAVENLATATDEALNEVVIDLKGYVDNKKIEQQKLEAKLLQADVMIANKTIHAQGSGTTIKYNGKYYVISAGHMVDKVTDEIWLMENHQEICKMKVVKVENNFPKADLLLLAPENPEFMPKYYVEISDREVTQSEEVYVVGNPLGIEDVLSIARVIGQTEYYTYVIDHSYYGSSGGGLYNLNGELVGVISHMKPFDPNPTGIVTNRQPIFVIHGMVNLFQIQKFMKDVK